MQIHHICISSSVRLNYSRTRKIQYTKIIFFRYDDEVTKLILYAEQHNVTIMGLHSEQCNGGD